MLWRPTNTSIHTITKIQVATPTFSIWWYNLLLCSSDPLIQVASNSHRIPPRQCYKYELCPISTLKVLSNPQLQSINPIRKLNLTYFQPKPFLCYSIFPILCSVKFTLQSKQLYFTSTKHHLCSQSILLPYSSYKPPW